MSKVDKAQQLYDWLIQVINDKESDSDSRQVVIDKLDELIDLLEQGVLLK